MTAAKRNFNSHLDQCNEAMAVYEFLEGSGYAAEFGLRFVWVASVSALDHYITELVVEKATEQFSNGDRLTPKLGKEGVPLESVMKFRTLSNSEAVVEFRNSICQSVRFRAFQKADDVADGLAYIWGEKSKWEKISNEIGIPVKSAKQKLNGICYRRDAIVHNADYNEATGTLTSCINSDAREVISYISKIATAIDSLVP